MEGGCSHVAMSSGEHEDEHEEVLSGVAAMQSVDLEHRDGERRDGETSLDKQPTHIASQRLHAVTPPFHQPGVP